MQLNQPDYYMEELFKEYNNSIKMKFKVSFIECNIEDVKLFFDLYYKTKKLNYQVLNIKKKGKNK